MGDSLKGKVAVITGSGQGVGRGIALYMASEGAKIVTNNRSPLDEKEKNQPGKAKRGDAQTVAEEIRRIWAVKRLPALEMCAASMMPAD